MRVDVVVVGTAVSGVVSVVAAISEWRKERARAFEGDAHGAQPTTRYTQSKDPRPAAEPPGAVDGVLEAIKELVDAALYNPALEPTIRTYLTERIVTKGRGGKEVERRFLVADKRVLAGSERQRITQGYFYSQAGYAARVRRTFDIDEHGNENELDSTITVKGPRRGPERYEYEIVVDRAFAVGMLEGITAIVEKTRHSFGFEQELWDVDVFHGPNEGLVIAEVETERASEISVPDWCGPEVTQIQRYNNDELAVRPYSGWAPADRMTATT